MHFNIGNFLLLATFGTSCCSILFGGLAWKGKNWVVSKNDVAAGLSGICLTFFCVGYIMQIVGVLLLIFILLISIFQNSFARRWNFYVIFFITIITLFLMSFIIMILSAFYFVSKALYSLYLAWEPWPIRTFCTFGILNVWIVLFVWSFDYFMDMTLL